MQLSRILIATDFADPAQVALRHAVAVARMKQAELIVLHVYDASASSATAFAHEAGTTRLVADLLARDIEQHKLALANLEAQVREDQVRVTSMFVEGHPDEVISRVAETEHVGLIVTGTHGRTGVARFLLGSVAANVARAAAAPVLVARGRAPKTFGRILVATDFSPAAEGALLAAIHLSGDDTRVDVAHFYQSALSSLRSQDAGQDAADRASARGKALLGRFAQPTRNLQLVTRPGPPGSGVQDQLERENYDLVCVGSRGKRGLGHLILGSVAETTLRYSACSVLVTHPPQL